jgi:hypothetical protein
MKGFLILGFVAAVVPAPVIAQGPLGTLERGSYSCELPGDASREAGIARPEANFRIIGASRYRSEQGRGIYLRRGDRVTFTSGPRRGEVYAVISEAFLRRVQDGQPGELRCIRKGE